ncbi:MAG: PTS sugar transporter subunit IIA [Planctomycetes bacterium]|nr:PTS sugar transporter subunit IIA [Planctomycetota bacterium]
MRLSDILREDLILVGLRARTQHEASEALLRLAVEKGDLPEDLRSVALQAVRDREGAMPTGVEAGVAIPHGVVEGLDEILAVLGLAPEGVAYGAADGIPASIIILLLVPPNLLQLHVRTLGGIARLLNDEPFRDTLRGAPTPGEAYRLITRAESGDPVPSHHAPSR